MLSEESDSTPYVPGFHIYRFCRQMTRLPFDSVKAHDKGDEFLSLLRSTCRKSIAEYYTRISTHNLLIKEKPCKCII
jgi:hypothetical protein